VSFYAPWLIAAILCAAICLVNLVLAYGDKTLDRHLLRGLFDRLTPMGLLSILIWFFVDPPVMDK
jgi:hypothetical protein